MFDMCHTASISWWLCSKAGGANECTTGLIVYVRNSFQSSTSAELRMSAETGSSLGARGTESSFRPASCGRRSALRWFTSLADQTRFSQASGASQFLSSLLLVTGVKEGHERLLC